MIVNITMMVKLMVRQWRHRALRDLEAVPAEGEEGVDDDPRGADVDVLEHYSDGTVMA